MHLILYRKGSLLSSIFHGNSRSIPAFSPLRLSSVPRGKQNNSLSESFAGEKAWKSKYPRLTLEKPGIFSIIFQLYFLQFCLPTHVGTQHLGNAHAAVSTQIIFQKRDKHAGRSHTGIVQRMRQIVFPVLAFDADLQAAALCVAQI